MGMKDQILYVLATSDAPLAMRQRLALDTFRYTPRIKTLPLFVEYDMGRISKEACLTGLQSFAMTEVLQDLRRYIDATKTAGRNRVSAMPALLEELSIANQPTTQSSNQPNQPSI